MLTSKQKMWYIKTMIAKVLADVEAGKKPTWHKPWRSNPSGCLSYNMTSDKNTFYSGYNQAFLPSGGYIAKGYAEKNKFRIKKDEYDNPFIVFFSAPKIDKNDDGEDINTGWISKLYLAYHFDQLELDAQQKALDKFPRLSIDNKQNESVNLDPMLMDADNKISKYLKTLNSSKFYGDKAFYNIATDHIQVPPSKAFNNITEFYSTLLHECAHSTGHTNRLNRNFGIFGDIDYAYEELIAELTACLLCKELKIDYVGGHLEAEKNSTAYLVNWLSKLNNNSEYIANAGIESIKACNFIKKIIG